MNLPATFVVRPIDGEADWAQARAIRQRVFVEEQQCPPEEEWDAYDEVARHFLGLADGRAVATARWRAAYHDGRAVAKLERFAVLPAYRGQGLGARLVEAVMADAHRAGFSNLFLHAQAHLQPFYERFGFVVVGERFDEAGIAHVPMATL